jgi:hypothetical protein
MRQSEIDAVLARVCTAPDQHRVLSPLPEPDYGAFGRGIRWALLLAAVLWVLIFTVGVMVASALNGSGP